jgi:hypothetical protein
MLLTFVLVVVGWIIFRAENVYQALDYMVRMGSSSLFSMPTGKSLMMLMLCVIFMIVEWFGRRQQFAIERMPVNSIFRWMIYLMISLIIAMMGGVQQEFIYFQF